MSRAEIIAMAEQAGYPHVGLKWNDQEQAFLMRLAALVAAKEREACAQVCDYYATALDYGGSPYTHSRECKQAAAAIRAGGTPCAA